MDQQKLLQRYEEQFDLLNTKHQLAKQKLETAGWRNASVEFEEVDEQARAFARLAADMQEFCSKTNRRDFPNHWAETIKVPDEF
ncbi:MAG: hypothetical protein ABI614_10005 [Planctomycetota bacterium]